MPVIVNIDVLLAQRKMSVGDFADAVGITAANVAVLKNGRAKAIRFRQITLHYDQARRLALGAKDCLQAIFRRLHLEPELGAVLR